MTVSIKCSIVSHRQGRLVAGLLDDLAKLHGELALTVVLTLNVPETLPFDAKDYPFPVRLVSNPRRRGFAANHNAAFGLETGAAEFFCVLNPDVRLRGNPFPPLLACAGDERAGVVAPAVFDGAGRPQANARPLPTPLSILAKAFGAGDPLPLAAGEPCGDVDWVAGMFMLFPSRAFAAAGGFDERYFLYYEDVDLCCRLRLSGRRVLHAPAAQVVHDAQRASHRHPAYFLRHAASMLRFFLSPVFAASRRLARAERGAA